MIQCVLLIRMLHEFFVRLYRLTENRMCFCCAQKKIYCKCQRFHLVGTRVAKVYCHRCYCK